MAITADILERRINSFVLWCPSDHDPAPELVICQIQLGNPPTPKNVRYLQLAAVPGAKGLYAVRALDCALDDNTTYHYWFQIDDSRSVKPKPDRITVTDPFACSVDWRLYPPDATDNTQPAAVIHYIGDGVLAEGDPGGGQAQFEEPDAPDRLPPNNQIVIYELPTAWALSRSLNQPERAVGTFLDVAALVDERIGGANFAELALLDQKRAYLADLGINALELLPSADSFFKREWGYDTSHYLAPDSELGYPEGNLSPTANQDLARLVDGCHRKNIRFFVDVVMAFAKEEPYNHIDAADFCIDDPKNHLDDPDALTSHRSDGSQSVRDGFGSTLWRYAKQVTTYDPISGVTQQLYPARQLMLTFLTRWMRDFRVDGVRMDSVENVANWDFIKAFKDLAHQHWTERWTDAGLELGDEANARFLVVGEELSLPPQLLQNNVLNGLWNEDFQSRIRAAILGQNVGNDNFEWTVKKAIDCRLTGVFTDGAQAINYVTKHDVEGMRHERLFTMLRTLPDDDVDLEKESLIEKRIKLSFACLLTAVGIPMFLAGEEFADQNNFFDQQGNVTQNGGKQVDPVNFGRLLAGPLGPDTAKKDDFDGYYGPMRRRIQSYVKALVKFRTSAPALAVNDTDFIWTDFNDGKQVLVWRRGGPDGAVPVIVVANFSGFASEPGSDYVIPTWPSPTPDGKKWVEITQGRDVEPAFVGREAIYSWEAKVYTLADNV